ncbi:hypothetical protein CY34DRAFT_324022 [Suillus luteus UH-Slu-Lm8-n1]|uniref:Uncharacterized protein n=1 Tax=Suillus luteus UH-Slu-Lm8-n1 TaxID=930992 RepID=A0A0D0ANQ2_9AGAM|nr:hypothetical protein CY34DRAFT_324022 [Suillus luteus UH-Slu-Lm8-n1]
MVSSNTMVSTIIWPEHFIEFNCEIVAINPDYDRCLTASWNDLLQEFDERTTENDDEGPNINIRRVHFSNWPRWSLRRCSMIFNARAPLSSIVLLRRVKLPVGKLLGSILQSQPSYRRLTFCP